MKTKLITIVCLLAFCLSSVPCSATDDLTVAADIIVMRPVCFVATILGTALFVVSLPVSAPSRSVKKTAHWLVVRPAKATFTRPVGELETLED
jgi:hypothetical protein